MEVMRGEPTPPSLRHPEEFCFKTWNAEAGAEKCGSGDSYVLAHRFLSQNTTAINGRREGHKL